MDNPRSEEAHREFLVRGEVRLVAEECGTDTRVSPISSYEKETCGGRGVGEVCFDGSVDVVRGDRCQCLGPLPNVRAVVLRTSVCLLVHPIHLKEALSTSVGIRGCAYWEEPSISLHRSSNRRTRSFHSHPSRSPQDRHRPPAVCPRHAEEVKRLEYQEPSGL